MHSKAYKTQSLFCCMVFFSRSPSSFRQLLDHPRVAKQAVTVLLLIHTSLLAYSAHVHSPTLNEPGHLASGLGNWKYRKFDLYCVNPPLVRMTAALPVMAVNHEEDWSRYYRGRGARSECPLGSDFLAVNGERGFFLLTMARWACIPFSCLGATICFCWSRDLYGRPSGVLACLLWCSSPSILSHAPLITPDAHATALGLTASYAFWCWLKDPAWIRATVAGIALGLAELAKTTLILFYPLWIVLWIAYRRSNRMGVTRTRWFSEFGALTFCVTISIYLVNLGYGFEGSVTRLGEYCFVSELFTTTESTGEHRKLAPHFPATANRFANNWLGKVPMPVPKHYVLGIDLQRYDFEQGLGGASYLRGQHQDHGWWYYYLYALGVKVPLGTWCLATLALGVTIFGRGYSSSWRAEMALLAPGLVILVFVSSQTGFSVHSRYVIPALPFFFIWTSKVARVFEKRPHARGRLAIGVMVVVALSWSVTSSLWAYPHSLSYFNELVGGPMNGGKHLLGSNIDWGQDLLYLKDWLDEHPDVKLDGLSYLSLYSATLAGIPETPYPAPGPNANDRNANRSADGELAARPGWYALSVNEIYDRKGEYRYFLGFAPVAVAGYSIYIYHITVEDANRLRGEIGLAELPEDRERVPP